MQNDCINCFFEQANKLFIKHNIQDEIAKDLIHRLNLFINENKETTISTPEASCFLHRLLKKELHNNDLYRKEKDDYNNLLMSLEAEIRTIIEQSANPFQTALRYALAGNIIDFGLPKSFNVFEALSAAVSTEPSINHSELLQYELQKASMVLYLGDNTGEIVLDKLLIETINHPNLYFAVRGGNIINDVTMKDARSVGITKITKVISNGYDAPSTIVNKCSAAFKKIFNDADIIMSKGQGNLEGLIDNTDKKIFFLLMVKCKVIARKLGVQEGEVVIYYNQHKNFERTNLK
jgi:damage-control phosphatase, subfamily I